MTLVPYEDFEPQPNGLAPVLLQNDEIALVRNGQTDGLESDAQLRAMAVAIIPADSGLSAGPSGGATTNNTVYGDCGYSWMYASDVGYKIADLWYGFQLYESAYAYEAFVALRGEGATYTDGHSGGLANRDRWEATDTMGVRDSGVYTARVEYLNAFTYSGVCTTGHPTDDVYVS